MEGVKKQWRRRLLSFYRLEKWVVSEAKSIERKNSWMTSLVNKKVILFFADQKVNRKFYTEKRMSLDILIIRMVKKICFEIIV
ncbi:hypothetical protein C656_07235 [Enterococcus hirae 57-03-H11]|nr:hypothetical protein F522_10115 [Enterococcus hirae 81-15-F4]OWW67081.1 hypothetical protein C656_07235 [Enterococcus hirae 57-03-H11]